MRGKLDSSKVVLCKSEGSTVYWFDVRTKEYFVVEKKYNSAIVMSGSIAGVIAGPPALGFVSLRLDEAYQPVASTANNVLLLLGGIAVAVGLAWVAYFFSSVKNKYIHVNLTLEEERKMLRKVVRDVRVVWVFLFVFIPLLAFFGLSFYVISYVAPLILWFMSSWVIAFFLFFRPFSRIGFVRCKRRELKREGRW